MKTLLKLFSIILICFCVGYSQDSSSHKDFHFLKLTYYLTLGVLPEYNQSVATGVNNYGSEFKPIVAPVETNLGTDFIFFNHFKIFFNINNYEYLTNYDITAAYPFQITYIIGTEIILNKNITLGFNHECTHPVIYNSTLQMSSNYYYHNQTNIFITFSNTSYF